MAVIFRGVDTEVCTLILKQIYSAGVNVNDLPELNSLPPAVRVADRLLAITARLFKAAQLVLAKQPELVPCPCRFDIAEDIFLLPYPQFLQRSWGYVLIRLAASDTFHKEDGTRRTPLMIMV